MGKASETTSSAVKGNSSYVRWQRRNGSSMSSTGTAGASAQVRQLRWHRKVHPPPIVEHEADNQVDHEHVVAVHSKKQALKQQQEHVVPLSRRRKKAMEPQEEPMSAEEDRRGKEEVLTMKKPKEADHHRGRDRQARRQTKGEPRAARREAREKRSQSRKEKRPRPLLKQLLWKVKKVPTAENNAAREESTSMSTHSKSMQQDAQDGEEALYALQERRSIKMQAIAPLKEPRYTMESSSQETQSGSEDEHYSCLNSFAIPSHRPELTPEEEEGEEEEEEEEEGDEEEQDCENIVKVETTFPQVFPLETLRTTHQQVHEVVLDDFVFHPANVHIQQGDVVVWRVSGQALPMVEHCLELVFTGRNGGILEATSVPIRPRNAVAWRFAEEGVVGVACAVYRSHGSVTIGRGVQREEKKLKVKRNHARRRQAKLHRSVPALPEKLLESGSETDESETLEVFHPPAQLARATQDTGVCASVLTQLTQMSAPGTSASYILIGDVVCPVSSETTRAVSPDPPCAAVEEVVGVVSSRGEAPAPDFEGHIIGMLKRSEETQQRQRSSFVDDSSAFNAAAAYDFFKQRFARLLQEERRIYYPQCVELPSPRVDATTGRGA